MRIHIREDAKPFALTAARKIPFGWRDQVKKQLDDLEAKSIISPVQEPTEWCHPIVVIPKKNSDEVRVCVDLTKLNSYVKRGPHPVCTPHEAVSGVSKDAKYFSKFDAKNGYFQMAIAPEDQHLTTFITPWKRYQFRRAPQGLVTSGDEYGRRGDQALDGVPRTSKVVDDILAHDEDYGSHLEHVWTILERCEQHGITLNPAKVEFAKSQVEFCGYELSPEGFTPDKHKVEAIASFPTPTNITDLRSFLGLVGQLSEFSPWIADAAEPLRDLLKPKNAWLWTSQHDAAFDRVKTALVSPPILAYFSPGLPTVLQTDASRQQGLGYVLMQQHGAEWKMIQCGSRFLTDTESRYAVIELEMLGIAWATKKCRVYLAGCPNYTLITDHRPLIPILNSRSMSEIENPRLLRLREKLTMYQFTAEWRPGTALAIPDALSRAPASDPTPEDEEDDAELRHHVRQIVMTTVTAKTDDGIRLMPIQADPLEKVREASRKDVEYQELRSLITSGFPGTKGELSATMRPYWSARDKLAVDDDLIVYGPRLVIPHSLRSEVLRTLHDSHQGINRTKMRARQTVYWPNIDNDVTNVVTSCHLCRTMLPSQPKEPMMTDPLPSRVFERVSADYFHHAGKTYLVYVDRLSNWPIVKECRGEATSRQLVGLLRETFAATGVPTVLRADGGPQFTARRTRDFLKRWGVSLVLSSPHYPQSNGHAEAGVKSVKRLIMKTTQHGDLDDDAFARGLLELRNTPGEHGRSPAQILFGHPLRSSVPVHRRAFAAAWQAAAERCERSRARAAENVRERYDSTAKTLPVVRIGTTVDVQDSRTGQWDRTGVVVGVGDHRDYLVKMPGGRVLWRNRRFLRAHRPLLPCSFPSRCELPVTESSHVRRDCSRHVSFPENVDAPWRAASESPSAVSESSSVASEPMSLRRSGRTRRPPNRLVVDPRLKSYD